MRLQWIWPLSHLGQPGSAPRARPSATLCTSSSFLPDLTWLFLASSACSCAAVEACNCCSSFWTLPKTFAVSTPCTDVSRASFAAPAASFPDLVAAPAGAASPALRFFPEAAAADAGAPPPAPRSAFHTELILFWSAFLMAPKPFSAAGSAGRFLAIQLAPFILGKHSKWCHLIAPAMAAALLSWAAAPSGAGAVASFSSGASLVVSPGRSACTCPMRREPFGIFAMQTRHVAMLDFAYSTSKWFSFGMAALRARRALPPCEGSSRQSGPHGGELRRVRGHWRGLLQRPCRNAA
mmetsp:Transcript_64500/g.181455  ORF Transcript_64500/g.181455 Transcript_64500/m.181455 type:complete len:294 (-) Transcript_64500:20-901(-)